MILGVDHLALSTDHPAGVSAALASAGMRLEFSEQGLPNGSGKRPLLLVYEPTHDISYLRPASGPRIELTRHAAALTRSASPLQVVFQGEPEGVEPFPLPEQADLSRVFAEGAGVLGARSVWWPAARCQCWVAPGENGTVGIRALLIPVTSLTASGKFWESGLGAVREREDLHHAPAYRRVAYRRPVPAWSLEIHLVEMSRLAETSWRLDQAGFPCIALLSSRLEEDIERATAVGAEVPCAPYELVVHERRLRICILRGPAGELVELIEIVRNPSRAG
jgi:hypothetical protein